MSIHPTALIDPTAELAADVYVGPYSVIGPQVKLASGCKVESHVVIKGPTEIGRNNHFFQFSSIGEACQDKKYAGEPTQLIIGDDNVFREYVTIHRGTIQDQGITRIGHRNWVMAYVHIAHDCIVGNDATLSNNATLAGHVHLGDGVVLGGFTGVHQFCQIGDLAMAGMYSVISKDIPAFVMAAGHPAKPAGLNSEGLRRRGFSKELIQSIKGAYKLVYRKGLTLEQACEAMKAELEPSNQLQIFIDSLQASTRGILR